LSEGGPGSQHKKKKNLEEKEEKNTMVLPYKKAKRGKGPIKPMSNRKKNDKMIDMGEDACKIFISGGKMGKLTLPSDYVKAKKEESAKRSKTTP